MNTHRIFDGPWYLEIVCFIENEKAAIVEALLQANYSFNPHFDYLETGVTRSGNIEKWQKPNEPTILLNCLMSPTSITTLSTLESGRSRSEHWKVGFRMATLVFGCAGLLPRPTVEIKSPGKQKRTIQLGDAVCVQTAWFASWGEVIDVMDQNGILHQSSLGVSNRKSHNWIEQLRMTDLYPERGLPPTITNFEIPTKSIVNKLPKVHALVTDKVIKTDFGIKVNQNSDAYKIISVKSKQPPFNEKYKNYLLPSLAFELDIVEMESHAFGLLERKTLGASVQDFTVVRILTDNCANKNGAKKQLCKCNKLEIPKLSSYSGSLNLTANPNNLGHECRDWIQLNYLFVQKDIVTDWVDQWSRARRPELFSRGMPEISLSRLIRVAQGSQQQANALAECVYAGSVNLKLGSGAINSAIGRLKDKRISRKDGRVKVDFELRSELLELLKSALDEGYLNTFIANFKSPDVEKTMITDYLHHLLGEMVANLIERIAQLEADSPDENRLSRKAEAWEDSALPELIDFFIGPSWERKEVINRIKKAFKRKYKLQ